MLKEHNAHPFPTDMSIRVYENRSVQTFNRKTNFKGLIVDQCLFNYNLQFAEILKQQVVKVNKGALRI